MQGYKFSTDQSDLQFDVIHRMLASSYWSPGIRRDLVELAFANSFSVGVYAPDGIQVGVARLVSDRATFAYLCDVFVEEPHRGMGIGKEMVRQLVNSFVEPHIRNVILLTQDMQPLYRQFGFVEVAQGRCMQLKRPAQNWS